MAVICTGPAFIALRIFSAGVADGAPPPIWAPAPVDTVTVKTIDATRMSLTGFRWKESLDWRDPLAHNRAGASIVKKAFPDLIDVSYGTRGNRDNA